MCMAKSAAQVGSETPNVHGYTEAKADGGEEGSFTRPRCERNIRELLRAAEYQKVNGGIQIPWQKHVEDTVVRV